MEKIKEEETTMALVYIYHRWSSNSCSTSPSPKLFCALTLWVAFSPATSSHTTHSMLEGTSISLVLLTNGMSAFSPFSGLQLLNLGIILKNGGTKNIMMMIIVELYFITCFWKQFKENILGLFSFLDWRRPSTVPILNFSIVPLMGSVSCTTWIEG